MSLEIKYKHPSSLIHLVVHVVGIFSLRAWFLLLRTSALLVDVAVWLTGVGVGIGLGRGSRLSRGIGWLSSFLLLWCGWEDLPE